MQKISEYEDRAIECRKMAAKTQNSFHREQLEEIARAWEMLANVRKKQMVRRLTRGLVDRRVQEYGGTIPRT